MDKQEMKRAYKDSKRPMGVYRIANSQNDTVFLGFSTDLPARFNRHKSELKFGSHRAKALQEMWNALGESAFEFEVLDLLEHKEDARASHDEELRVLAEMWAQKLEEAGQFRRTPEERISAGASSPETAQN